MSSSLGIFGRSAVAVCLAAVMCTPTTVEAQNSTTVTGGGVQGVGIVNSASGNNNQQANAGVIADGAVAFSTSAVSQHLATSGVDSRSDSATIAAGAFTGSSGWVAVNGAAGNDNQQANLTAFSFGIEAGALADTSLSQTRASTEPTGSARPADADFERSVAIGEGAFGESSGVVQVSLVAGDRNSSANSFAMSVSGPAGQ